jgi:hypothetical protein
MNNEPVKGDLKTENGFDWVFDGSNWLKINPANEPVAWINRIGKDGEHGYLEWDKDDSAKVSTPLYTHPHPDNLGLAESIIKQQQLEIEALKKQLDTRTKELIGASFYEHDYKTMVANSEPVAWWTGEFNDEADDFMFDKTKQNHMNHINSRTHEFFPIPLYTHPVKEQDEQFKKGFETGKEEGWKAHKFHHPVKELTDEEIMEVATINLGHSMGLLNWMGFARAILRKAQEK